ncbi:5-oxoprolinase subunit PxpB [Thalassobellus citreus]|uniref:5-oxoprolinase subunit PxpB n=1 Tax=Thalassobellus citreus TaxID=3367752 RepID=UPI0037B652AB
MKLDKSVAFNLSYKPFGERSILIEWPALIDETILQDIIRFKDCINSFCVESIVEVKTAYNSLLIIYSGVCRNFENEVDLLKNIYKSRDLEHDIVSKSWVIPVCYDPVFGVDLDAIAVEKKLSKDAIIKRHSEAVYTVFFIGFLPGFLYLGGLDESLHMPRKSTPRLQIEKGAIAIGGQQTGVYPNASPGGWNIIGNTPVEFFNPKLESPCFAKAGDKIIFKSVSLKTYNDIKILVEAGVYQLENERIDG